jgi:hypothetical protein
LLQDGESCDFTVTVKTEMENDMCYKGNVAGAFTEMLNAVTLQTALTCGSKSSNGRLQGQFYSVTSHLS